MANRKPHAGLFKPGQSGNPSGRPPADPELQKLRALTANEFKEVANLALMDDIGRVKSIESDPAQPLFRRWLARLAIRGFERGDQGALEFFANRLLGKVPDKLEAIGAVVRADVPVDELRTRLEALRKPNGNSEKP